MRIFSYEKDCSQRWTRHSPVPIILQEFSDRIQKLFLWVSHPLIKRNITTLNWKWLWSFYWLTFLALLQGEDYSDIWKIFWYLKKSVLSILGRGQVNGMNWLQVAYGWLLCWFGTYYWIPSQIWAITNSAFTFNVYCYCLYVEKAICSLFCDYFI